MVCLYGVTLRHIEDSLTKQELKNYPLWNWLANRLTNFIYLLEPLKGTNRPYIPEENDHSVYAKWFNTILTILKETFYDATPERLYQCCENPPAEEVAIIIYEATPLELLYRFKNHVQQYSAEVEAQIESGYESGAQSNPADDDTYNSESDNDSLPELESDNDSLPALIAC